MLVFSNAGEGCVYVYWPADDLTDTATTMAKCLMNPPTEYLVPFTTGGNDMYRGQLLTGATSSAVVRVVDWVQTGGSNAGDNMTGVAFIEMVSGTITAGENLAVGASVKMVPVTAEIKHGAYGLSPKAMYISCETQNMRYTMSGIPPTNSDATPASMGHLLTAGDELMITGWQNIKRFSFINAVSTSNGALHMTVMY